MLGALTSRTNSFRHRIWEFISISRVDIVDSLGSSIRYEIKDGVVIKVIALFNKYLNRGWMTNITRYHYDSVLYNKLVFPLIRINLIVQSDFFNFFENLCFS